MKRLQLDLHEILNDKKTLKMTIKNKGVVKDGINLQPKIRWINI